jgi:exonuclease SbcC
MIFKHLFRSKHQNPDPQVRLQAIENLNKQDPQQKSVLHELAFNDSDVGVSLAALQKLDSFVLWYKMSEIAKNERVQKKSQQFVENTLLDGQNDALTEQEKRKFILETRDIRLIEKLLGQSWIQKDTELAMMLLQKTDKPLLQEKLLFDTQNESLQTAILQTLTDGMPARKLLNKIQKKTSSSKLKVLANETLQGWLTAEQAPVEVEHQVKMVLSRLLALKDQGDLLVIQQQQIELTQQYTKISERFACLSDLKRTEIEQKHTDISSRVERTIALLEPQWQAQQAELIFSQNLQTLVLDVEQSLAELSAQLSIRVSEISSSEVDAFVQKINIHTEKLQELTSQLPAIKSTSHRRLEQLKNQLLSSLETLESLPKFQQAIQVCQTLIEKFSGLTLPSDASQIEAAEEYLREQKQLWRTTIASYHAHVPNSLSQQWNESLKLWQQAIKTIKKQLDGEVSRCRNKLKAVESLINQGKFKAAMVLYQRVQKWFDVLPEKQQGQLQRTFISVKEQIENLKDWQDYIAAPRKPALLNEVEELIAQPLKIDAQSTAIKSLRYQWNSLGKTDTESDHALNAAFEIAIEKAFAPCREFYDQQQKQREQNMLDKQQLLAEIKALGEQPGGITELAKALRSVQQKWKNIGEVDLKQRNELYDSYQQLLNPLRDKVSAFYQDNAEQKQALLSKAEKLSELESVDEAIEQAKKLQQTWKTIEHAGKKAEAQLWPAFRKANDSLFAKKSEVHQQEQTQLKEQVTLVKEQVTQFESSFTSADDKESVQIAMQEKQGVIDAINTLPARDRRALEQRVQTLFEQQKVKLAELAKAAISQTYLDLFAALKEWQTDNEMPASAASLNKQWQQCFREVVVGNDRHDLTIKMEIVAQQNSPKKDAEKRQSIQMQLMAQKLQSGDSLDLLSLLKDWISAGSLSKSDITLLKRIEPLFVHS